MARTPDNSLRWCRRAGRSPAQFSPSRLCTQIEEAVQSDARQPSCIAIMDVKAARVKQTRTRTHPIRACMCKCVSLC
eukprot:6204694-Pleurochrysis_carterae.AAC.2